MTFIKKQKTEKFKSWLHDYNQEDYLEDLFQWYLLHVYIMGIIAVSYLYKINWYFKPTKELVFLQCSGKYRNIYLKLQKKKC